MRDRLRGVGRFLWSLWREAWETDEQLEELKCRAWRRGGFGA